MLIKLKVLRIILGIILILSWVIAGVFFYMYKTDVEAQLAAKDADIASLNASIAEIGELVPAYTVAIDVPDGKVIEETDLVPIEVPLSMANNLVSDPSEIVGKHFKVPMTAGSVITIDCIYEEVVSEDMRFYDVIVDVVPIGLEAGSFVDIRIKFGTGADFVGISHRRVAEVNENVLKLVLTENDIHMLSSMTVDNIVFNQNFTATYDVNNDGKVNENDRLDPIGSYIYAVEYVMGGVQDKAGEYYSPSPLVQGIMAKDPNIMNMELSANDLALKRKLIEAGLQDTTTTAEKIRNEVTDAIKEGQKAYEKRVEAEAKAAQEN